MVLRAILVMAILGLTVTVLTVPRASWAKRETRAGICHKGRRTLNVSRRAVRAHLAHGDTRGPCVPGSPSGAFLDRGGVVLD